MRFKKNINFDLEEFEKVEDIIFLDEPILTHLKNNKKDFLLYLVDTLEDHDILLLLELSEEEIFEYLTKRKTLKSVITSNKNFIYQIYQDFNGSIIDVEVTQSNALPLNFLPDDHSYLKFEPAYESYYFNFIKNFEAKSYLNLLRNKAFYLKLAPTNDKYSDTIGFNELSNQLLRNISSSFKNFLKADFFEVFKETKSDNKKLNTLFNRLLSDLDYRMVDLKFGSFEVGLAVDEVMKNSIEDKKVREWAVDVGYKFKDLVLDEDYDPETVQKILSRYNEDERRKIFEPLFKVTENPNFELRIKDSKDENYNRIQIKDKSVIDKIAPPKPLLPNVLESKEYEIIQITTIKEKDKVRKSIKIGENTLFDSYDDAEVILKKKDFVKYNYEVDDNIQVPLKISTDKDIIWLRANYDNLEFEEMIDSGNLNEGIEKIISKIYEYIVNQ